MASAARQLNAAAPPIGWAKTSSHKVLARPGRRAPRAVRRSAAAPGAAPAATREPAPISPPPRPPPPELSGCIPNDASLDKVRAAAHLELATLN
jgi:hypothetical protein